VGLRGRSLLYQPQDEAPLRIYFGAIRSKDITRDFRVNERIRAREVRLIGEGGENQLLFTRDALALARQRGLDLVEVAPNEVPPVCKLMDYGRFRYEQTKKERDSRKTQKQVLLKEVRFSPKIDDHDIETKTKMARRFLEEGHKVKMTVRFKGREMAHPELGRNVLEAVRLSLGEGVIIELPAKMEGKSMIMIVSSRPPKGGIAKPKPAAQPAAQAPTEDQAPAPAAAASNGAAAPQPVAAEAAVAANR
jgi:translation initiation factor IF-3